MGSLERQNMNYTKNSGYFSNPKGQKFFYRKNLIERKTLNPVIFVHGALEHSGRYENLTSELQKKRHPSFGFDLRGHGKSHGKKGDAKSVDQMTQDLENFITYLKDKYEIQRFILIGHSLGGLICLNYAIKKKNQKKLLGLYVSAPALSVRMTASMRVKRFFGEKLIIKIAPKLRLPIGLGLDTLTHDKNELEKYKKDPLVFDLMSIRLAMDILNKGDEVIEKSKKIKDIPVFITHGDGDKISYDQGSKKAFENLSTTKKKLKIYPGYHHELFNEDINRRKKVLCDLVEWCEKL